MHRLTRFPIHRPLMLAVVLSGWVVATSRQVYADDKPINFLKDIAPIFQENCFACHDAKSPRGRYNMTTAAGLMEGGSIGDAVVPGDPEASEIYLRLTTDEPELIMPPPDKGKPLNTEQINLVKRWINAGAKLDSDLDPKADLTAKLRSRWTPPRPPGTYVFPVMVNALAFTPNGKQVVVSGHHELTIWNLADGSLDKRIHTRAERTYAMQFTSEGYLIVAGGRPGQEGDVCVYDLDARPSDSLNQVPLLDGVNDSKVLLARLLQCEDAILCLALSPDGQRLAAAGCDRAVRVWDLSNGVPEAALLQTIENHADWVMGLSFADNNRLLFSASRDKTAKVWDLETQEPTVTFPMHAETVFDVVATSDAQLGISVGADKSVRFWETKGDGKEVRHQEGHQDDIYKLLRHPTQNWVITCSADHTVRVWDTTKKAKPVQTLKGLSDCVFALAVSADGKRVAAGAYNGEVSVWNIDDGTLVNKFNASPGLQTQRP